MPLFGSEQEELAPAVTLQPKVIRTFETAKTETVVLLAANQSRVGFSIYNRSSSPLYIDYGDKVAFDNFAVKIKPNHYFESPYRTIQAVCGLWESNEGKALIREFIEEQ